ncbi:glycosyl hydrolase [Flavobacterium ustbae]|uniref:glycosyl hydrolase n=1 Tax=Flavobacterium ustbae TaxID=2488790 RepID=UPI000F796D41|nr:glycosyl hydrolase [Flavobacterium ustbae]
MIQKLFLTILLFFANLFLFAQSPKRGIAYGYHSRADMAALKPGISWWYNWSPEPDAGLIDNYESLGVEFVPMAWGKVNDAEVSTFIRKIKPGAKYLIAFNEPNFNDGSRLTPQDAVNAWVNIEKIAAAKNLEIISASPAYNGSNNYGGISDPLVWHNQFFQLCPKCKVDYIAFHTYDNSAASVIGVTNLLKKYNKPLWITEFSNRVTQTAAEKIAFMKQILTNFENDPDIFRYSWFSGRIDPNWIEMKENPLLAPESGVLRPIGTEYINVPYTSKKINVPGRITANKHYRRKGTGLQNTSDSSTGQNVCFINSGDWNEFMLNVTEAGNYNMKFRFATLKEGKFDISVNGVKIKTDETVPLTGGYQIWTDKNVNGITLPKGEVYLKIDFKTDDLNFNFIDVVSTNLGVEDHDLEKESFTIYPNPVKTQSTLHIKSSITEPLTIKIIDMKGDVCFYSDDYFTNEDIKIGEKLAKGVYIVNASYGNVKKSTKIIKN